jgi:hypothetical protein
MSCHFNMHKTLLSLALTGLALAGCKKEAPAPKPTNTVGENPITAPVDYLGAVSKAQQSAVKTLSTAGLDHAIKMFFGQEGRYPKNLDELVSSGTLDRLPAAPQGMKFSYDAASGQVKVVPQ